MRKASPTRSARSMGKAQLFIKLKLHIKLLALIKLIEATNADIAANPPVHPTAETQIQCPPIVNASFIKQSIEAKTPEHISIDLKT